MSICKSLTSELVLAQKVELPLATDWKLKVMRTYDTE